MSRGDLRKVKDNKYMCRCEINHVVQLPVVATSEVESPTTVSVTVTVRIINNINSFNCSLILI